MAFAYTVTSQTVIGDKRMVWGTFTNGGGDSGGTIITGLSNCDQLQLQSKGAAVINNAPVVNATFPVAGGQVPIVCTLDEDGYWLAFGV